ncbi:MAG: 2Fe-2S ferredoxin [Myxococcales bacterium 68-20]|nr:Rieske (2Fe-2S) protein [Myxococcales bacterium]OJY27676.1 MAG: 2Fe-2S ferredoxin [Myxococcales bacterium 68-20]
MTEARKRVYTTPAGVQLCSLDAIGVEGARNFVLQIGDAFFHGFVVRRGDEVFGYVDQCPHQGLPLARKLDDYLTPDKTLVNCAWHGALFRVEDGMCVGGPCAGARLSPWPVRVANGIVETA